MIKTRIERLILFNLNLGFIQKEPKRLFQKLNSMVIFFPEVRIKRPKLAQET